MPAGGAAEAGSGRKENQTRLDQVVAGIHRSVKTPQLRQYGEHLPDAVTIATLLHFIPLRLQRDRQREGGQGEIKG